MMIELILSSYLVVLVSLFAPPQATRESFRQVEGATLEARIDAAQRRARSEIRGSRYWTAWGFEPKPGISIDSCTNGDGGSVNVVGNVSFSSTGPETRNVAVFALRAAETGAVERIQVYNLDRNRTYEGYPVYWLGKPSNDESLDVLKRLVDGGTSARSIENAVVAVAVHDGKRADDLLEEYARRAASTEVRKQAIMWLGIATTRHALVADFVRDERENVEVRKQAAIALGVSRSETAVATLKELYGSVANRQVRHEILTAVAIHDGSEDQAIDFLIGVAEKDTDRENRKQALFWLGQKAGKRSLDYLESTIGAERGDVEVQKHAVFAMSQRDPNEAIPVLIKVARTHPSGEVRKQAVFWLTQLDGQDARVLDFLKELLEK